MLDFDPKSVAPRSSSIEDLPPEELYQLCQEIAEGATKDMQEALRSALKSFSVVVPRETYRVRF